MGRWRARAERARSASVTFPFVCGGMCALWLCCFFFLVFLFFLLSAACAGWKWRVRACGVDEGVVECLCLRREACAGSSGESA